MKLGWVIGFALAVLIGLGIYATMQDQADAPDVSAGPDDGPGGELEKNPTGGGESATDDDADAAAPDADPDTDATDKVEPLPVEPAVFSFHPAGDLLDGSGQGSDDTTLFSPEMVFPIESDPAYPQSMVFRPGGGLAPSDGPQDQCDAVNYDYPWRDNFCETRSSDFSTPYCDERGVHLGQDIRVGTPAECNTLRGRPAAQRTLHPVVAAEDGYISNIGRYTVNVRAGGRIYRYLHLNMAALQVEFGEQVEAGQVIGYVSNDFGGTPTTFHLHFEIKMNTAEHGWAYVPPYTSLVAAYERREGGRGEVIAPDPEVGIASVPR